MKTFKQVVETPMLKIKYDENSECPREWDNLGIFVSKSVPDDRFNAGDGEKRVLADELYEFMVDLQEEKTFGNVGEHIKEAQKMKPEYMIFPINKYEHGGVSLTVGVSGGFDNSMTGFYFVNREDGEAKDENYSREKMLDIIAGEMENMTSWVNGDIYYYELYSDNGELEDSGSGFYSVEEIRENLPAEWKDEDLTEYLK